MGSPRSAAAGSSRQSLYFAVFDALAAGRARIRPGAVPAAQAPSMARRRLSTVSVAAAKINGTLSHHRAAALSPARDWSARNDATDPTQGPLCVDSRTPVAAPSGDRPLPVTLSDDPASPRPGASLIALTQSAQPPEKISESLVQSFRWPLGGAGRRGAVRHRRRTRGARR